MSNGPTPRLGRCLFAAGATSGLKTLTGDGVLSWVLNKDFFSLLTLEHQRIPPTINYKMPDPAIPLDVVPNTARDASVRHALSNSFGFGGQNFSLVMGREPS